MKIKIIHNPLKHWTEEVKKELVRHLAAEGHKIVNKGADATVCIGGDGTVLYANYRKKLEGKVLGIGSKRSFIPADIMRAIQAVKKTTVCDSTLFIICATP